jgi:hypothetical protein
MIIQILSVLCRSHTPHHAAVSVVVSAVLGTHAVERKGELDGPAECVEVYCIDRKGRKHVLCQWHSF